MNFYYKLRRNLINWKFDYLKVYILILFKMFNGKFSVELFLIFNSSFLDSVLRFFFFNVGRYKFDK